jgi:exodeoxyribonuclease V alpha subunit
LAIGNAMDENEILQLELARPEQGRTLSGTIRQVIHHNEEDGWTVAGFIVEGYPEPVTIVGHLVAPAEDQGLVLQGRWVRHPRYGDQFKFSQYQVSRPTSPKALERYLASGVLKGVGPVTAKRMVEAFGCDILQVLDESPHRLSEIPGISEGKAEKIRLCWTEQKGVQEVMLFLQGHGISAAYAHRIFRHYGGGAVEVVEQNPYRLAAEVSGIGFKTADRIAQQLGFPVSSPFRIEAGLIHTLEEAADQGHVFLPRHLLLSSARNILQMPSPTDADFIEDLAVVPELEEALSRLLERGQLAAEFSDGEETAAVYLPEMYRAERNVAADLVRLIESPATAQVSQELLREWQASNRKVRGVMLSEEQAQAVAAALAHKVLVITGGPGVGKTTTTKAIVDLFDDAGCKIELACPTGRAAKRLSELTQRPARTIHRLLELDPVSWVFRRNRRNPLAADVVVVDEASMLDLQLTRALLEAIPDGARMIFVGDADQLPSVGPGNVLRDLLGSGPIAAVRLQEIFRQEKESLIIVNAHRVNSGQMPLLKQPEGRALADCRFLSLSAPEEITRRVIQLVKEELPAAGFLPADIQILTPMNKGELGTIALNRLLQATLNPPAAGKRELRRGEKILREGDRVMQVKNNYSKQVFNGDVGTVTAVDGAAQALIVQFLDQAARYEAEEMEELELAYAMSIHKSQGSEYPAVIILAHPSHYVMLQRNLLYTALTRAQRLAIIAGSNRAIWRAVHNDRQVRRFTRLQWRLQGGA